MGTRKQIKFTGERLVSGMEGVIKLEHLHRYAVAMEYVENRIVLDVASGDGYGTNLLSQKAKSVFGLDIHKQSIIDSKKMYQASNLLFDNGCISKMPYPNNTFDVIVCFETIEHIDDFEKALLEIKRVLKEDGILIMSTPNKLVYSDERNIINKFHTHEFYVDEYKTWLDSHFKFNTYIFQNPIIGSFVFSDESHSTINYKGNYDQINKELIPNYKYIISISSTNQKIYCNSSHFIETNINTIFEAYCKKSISYKIGSWILWPLKSIKKWLKF